MITFNRLFLTAGAISMLAASSVVGLSPGTAAAASTCGMGVEPPTYNGSINASAAWWGCYRGSHFTVVLRQDRRFWPDKTLRSAKGQGVSGARTLVYPCGTNFDPIKVFVEIRHGGKKVQSARTVLPCG